MKKDTHTPDPWRIETWVYQNGREVVTIQTDKDAIATVCNLWRDGDNSTFEVMANARLMVAAPDLLEALEKLCDMADEGDVAFWVAEWDKARAAIAKAKGGGS